MAGPRKSRDVSLETDDPVEALRRAREVRGAPILQSSQGLLRDINRYLESKRKLNVYSPATERVTRAVLAEFANRLGESETDSVSRASAAAHYARLQSRVAETTAQIHMRALRAFFNWCVRERIIRESPFRHCETCENRSVCPAAILHAGSARNAYQ